jgi:hypothetical protein
LLARKSVPSSQIGAAAAGLKGQAPRPRPPAYLK